MSIHHQATPGEHSHPRASGLADKRLAPGCFCSPYHRWNLTRNPFGELTRAERSELAIVPQMSEWSSLMADSRTAIEFVGDCGFGKTTHLLAFQSVLPDISYVYYPPRGYRPALPQSRPLLIDEAQRMGYFRRRQMLRGPGPLVIGTHRSLARSLRSQGFRVTSVDVSRPKQAWEIQQILNRRIEASRFRQEQSLPEIDLESAGKLAIKFSSNLRAIEAFLYEYFQMCVLERASWPPAL